MTGVAILFELAFMGIEVAIDTPLELESDVHRHPVITRLVALGTGSCLVLAGQREMGFGVIEILFIELGALPRRGAVALQAISAESSLVVILVTGGAGGAQTHVCARQVLLA